ncbi:MAG TPA: hypothetical protein VMP67_00760 [Candidatus Limnocylindria bacterium]|nr:hypothetical protein [Candidatus Limnocylindria bacterium]
MRLLLICLSLALAACAAPAPVTPGASPTAVAGSPTADPSTSCTGQPPTGQALVHPGWPPEETFELVPILASSELAVGQNRVLLSLLDDENNQLASPERPVEMRFYNLAADPAQPAVTAQAEYMPTTEALPGLYRAAGVEFECWGEWGLEALTAEPDGSQRVGRMVFPVRPTSSTPAIGAPAPASQTPTAATPQEIAAISTDTQPDPDLYTTSVDSALAEGRPFLLIFSTPAFCATRTCGPALDIVKAAAADYGEEVAFIHVEPYELRLVEGSPQLALDERNQPVVVESVREWGLPSEPYIFVVDAEGRVAAKMEGVAAEDEIRDALEAVGD